MRCQSCGRMYHGVTFEHGFCAHCWVNLTPAERAIAMGEEPPVEKVIHTESQTIRRVYSEGPWPIVVCLWVWRVGMSVLAVLVWRKVNGN